MQGPVSHEQRCPPPKSLRHLATFIYFQRLTRTSGTSTDSVFGFKKTIAWQPVAASVRIPSRMQSDVKFDTRSFARNIRIEAIKMVARANASHIGGAITSHLPLHLNT